MFPSVTNLTAGVGLRFKGLTPGLYLSKETFLFLSNPEFFGARLIPPPVFTEIFPRGFPLSSNLAPENFVPLWGSLTVKLGAFCVNPDNSGILLA